MEQFLGMFILVFAGCAGIGWLMISSRRGVYDVAYDLDDIPAPRTGRDVEGRTGKVVDAAGSRLILNDAFAQMGLYTREERNQHRTRIRVMRILIMCGAVFSVLLFTRRIQPDIAVGALLSGASFVYLWGRSQDRALKERFTRQLDFFLPIVMERLVMAVQAGLDVVSAISAVRDIDSASARGVHRPDPVSRLLGIVYSMTDNGVPFEESLREISGNIPSRSVRHAFVHLALAHREGGELMMPLRELSDATQLYFQESVEEQIATLPVKATPPLLCTFAGLIICFITAPLVQVMEMTSKALPQ
jgi:hypothetical protein